MNKILWFINENTINITYKNKAKAAIKKLPFAHSSSKYLLQSKSDNHIGYAYIFKQKNLLNKKEQYGYLRELIMKAIDETGTKIFALLGVEAFMMGYVLNDFKNQFISGAELMSAIFIATLEGLAHSNKICFVIDQYTRLFYYNKIFELFGDISILCENVESIDEYVRTIYENTATSIYVTSNPAILHETDIVFYVSANKNYSTYLTAHNTVLDVFNIIDQSRGANLIHSPSFMDFYDRRITGILLNDMTINASCAQSLLYALDIKFNEYDKEIKLL